MTMVHATLAPGASMTIPWRRDFNALAYVLSGRGTVGDEKRPVRSGQLTVFGNGASMTTPPTRSAGSTRFVARGRLRS